MTKETKWFLSLPYDKETGKIDLPKSYDSSMTDEEVQLWFLRLMLERDLEDKREDFWDE